MGHGVMLYLFTSHFHVREIILIGLTNLGKSHHALVIMGQVGGPSSIVVETALSIFVQA